MTRPMVRPYAGADLPVLTGRQAAELDARAIREMGVPEASLMERAGTAAASLVMELVPRGTILVVAGKGNNGGDALVAARCLRAWGREVEVLLAADRPVADPLLHGWDLRVGRTTELDDDALAARLSGALSGAGAVVDGVLGTGITGAPRGEAARVISLLHAARTASPGQARLVALDIPSGVDADTGEAAGPVAAADVTVSFGWPKLGTLLHPGRAYAGRLVTLEIGFPPLPADVPAARLLTPAWARAHRPVRSPVTHKNRVGAVAVVAGRPGMAGAAVLS
ncbi:MAG TPA: NAD(P)H-hydrate epimerase, partial [Longimicrobiales bacterium]|nr:NAD(P)H-hydrate epimerase [Longimicrobiales bacterium]